MGWMDKALATAKLTADKAVKVSKELAEEFDAGLSSRDDYRSAKELAAEFRTKGMELAAGARDLTAEVAKEVGETELGAMAGQKMRSAAGVLSTLRILTALKDVAKARHGVDNLYASLLVQPQEMGGLFEVEHDGLPEGSLGLDHVDPFLNIDHAGIEPSAVASAVSSMHFPDPFTA